VGNTAGEIPPFAVGETRIVSISFAGKLDTSELLTGTPTIVEQTTTDLTITSVAVNTTALTINNRTVPIGEAVQGKVVGMLEGGSGTGSYTLLVTAATDAGQTLKGYIQFTAGTE